jgi:SpoU rRNA methylase family enzyme
VGEKMSNVYTKLMAARLKLQNSPLKKSGKNAFAGYSYFELGDFLPTVQNIFSDLGLCGVVSYTKELATLTITDGTDSIVITSPMGSAALKGCHEVQNVGAVETYQRRYLWVTAMEIVEHDVLDATTGTDKGAPVKKPSVVEPPKESITPMAGALDGFTTDELDSFARLAEEITYFVNNDDVPSAKNAVVGLSGDEQKAVWSLLESHIRSKYKKG